jgi:hypothetical protein
VAVAVAAPETPTKAAAKGTLIPTAKGTLIPTAKETLIPTA